MATIRSIGKAPKSQHETEIRFRELRLQLPPVLFDASTAPVDADDNYADGWKAGSLWYDTTNRVAYFCAHPGTPGSPDANWQQIGATNATAGGVAGAGALDTTADYLCIYDVSLTKNVRTTIDQLFTAGLGSSITPPLLSTNDDMILANRVFGAY